MAYRIYVTDCLQLITENTAKSAPGCRYISRRYADIIMPVEFNGDPQAIIDKVIADAGLVVI